MPAGTTLASPYNLDLNADARGADGKWDRGAYERGRGERQPQGARRDP